MPPVWQGMAAMVVMVGTATTAWVAPAPRPAVRMDLQVVTAVPVVTLATVPLEALPVA